MRKNTPQQLQEVNPLHQPVLLDAVLALLQPSVGESYLDLTAGYGGHARAVIKHTKQSSAAVLVDRDENAIRQLQPLAEDGARIIHTDFVSAALQLIDEHKTFDMILVDLGVSSPQLDRPERGFSFRNSGPLDMRMDQRQDVSAYNIVNQYSADAIAKIVRDFGEERPKLAQTIANAIVQARPIETTADLASIVERAVRGPRHKIHPATRTFQAIRIAVNQELLLISKLLPLIPELLKPGGRVAIISFHSLEDRLVKQYLTDQVRAGYEAELSLLTKKPISGETEQAFNPRSRSAKLRGAVKIKNERT